MAALLALVMGMRANEIVEAVPAGARRAREFEEGEWTEGTYRPKGPLFRLSSYASRMIGRMHLPGQIPRLALTYLTALASLSIACGPVCKPRGQNGFTLTTEGSDRIVSIASSGVCFWSPNCSVSQPCQSVDLSGLSAGTCVVDGMATESGAFTVERTLSPMSDNCGGTYNGTTSNRIDVTALNRNGDAGSSG